MKIRSHHFGSIWLAIILESMGWGLVYPMMTLIFTSQQHPIIPPNTSPELKNFYLGLGYLLYPLVMFFGASFMGDLSDVLGRRKILLISMFGLAVSFCCMGIGTDIASLSLLFLGRGLSGLFAGANPVAQAAVADMSTQENKKSNISFLAFMTSFGIILGPVLGGIFADQNIASFFRFSTPFYISAVLSLINFLWMYLQFEETFIPQKIKKIQILRPIKIFIEAFQQKRVSLLAFTFLIMQISFGIFYQLIQVRFATQFDYSTWQLGLFNAGIGAAFVVMMYLNTKIFVRVFSENTLAISTLFLTGICLLILSILQGQIGILIFSFLGAGIDMIAYSVMIIAFSDAVSSKKQGWIMGIFGAVVAISWSISGFATNLLSIMSVEMILLIGAILMLITAIIMIFYIKKYPRPFINTQE